MQHGQRWPFSHLDTDHHSYSPRHANRTCSLSVGFSQNHSSLNSGPVSPKTNLVTEISFVHWLAMKWGDLTAECCCFAALVARSLSLKCEIHAFIERISPVNANTPQQASSPLFLHLFCRPFLILLTPFSLLSFFCSLSEKKRSFKSDKCGRF